MLDHHQISDLARDVAHAHVKDMALDRVLIEPATASDDREALRLTLVLTPESIRKLTGDQTLDILVAIQRGLARAGEDRFPIVEYATEQELEAEAQDDEARFDED